MSHRHTPIEMSSSEFREAGHYLVEQIAAFLENISQKPVTTGESPSALKKLLGNVPLPVEGSPAGMLLQKAAPLLFNHSLFNGHPKFFGYITSSAAPIGALADLLAATVNPNVGANILSPMGTEIEKQTIQWLVEFIGVPSTFGGLLVSGGNMANFTGFLAGRTVMMPKNVKEDGISMDSQKFTIYCSKATHTWVEKAAVLFGLGLKAIRWIETDTGNKMQTALLEERINDDKRKGYHPLMVIGTAGDVSTGAVDDLQALAEICRRHQLWFHVDGAYGIPAAVLPELNNVFSGIEHADSIALDPHKWLYSPLEAGCTLVKNPHHLVEAFSSHPVYYNFSNDAEPATLNFYEYGLQNSRGFRALKVWLMLQQVGRRGYEQMIREDIVLAKQLFDLAAEHPELEPVTHSLSITTLRYVPKDATAEMSEAYLNQLNETLLNDLQKGGEVFLSNALVGEKYCLRACIVNFRTSAKDIEEVVEIILREGRKTHSRLMASSSAVVM